MFQKSLVFKYKTALRGNWRNVPKSIDEVDSEEFMRLAGIEYVKPEPDASASASAGSAGKKKGGAGAVK